MKRGRRILLIVVACAIIAGIAGVLWPREREPVYQGKKLSEWLAIYGRGKAEGSPSGTAAADAVRRIGTNALPFLVGWVRNNRDLPRWRQRLWNLAYGWRAKYLVALVGGERPEIRAARAHWGFEILGEGARPALPELVQIARTGRRDASYAAIIDLAYLGKDALPPLLAFAKDQTFDGCVVAMESVAEMGYLGTNAHPAVLFLVRSLADELLVDTAADGLGRLKLEPEVTVPALEALVQQGTNRALREIAMNSLAKFGDEARPAVPALINVLRDRKGWMSWSVVSNALLRIAPEVLRTNGADAVHGNGKAE